MFKKLHSNLILLFIIACPFLRASSMECNEFKNLNYLEKQTYHQDLNTRVDAAIDIKDEIKFIAQRLNAYIFNNMTLTSQIINCIDESIHRNLELAMSKEFNERILEHLLSYNNKSLNRIVKDILEIKKDNFIFKVSLNSEKHAGMLRISGVLFINIVGTDLETLTFRTIHELLHKLDKDLNNSIKNYTSLENYESIAKILNKKNLTSNDLELIDQHIHQGLNKGLFAEYRAWYLTFKISNDLKLQTPKKTELYQNIKKIIGISKEKLLKRLVQTSRELEKTVFLKFPIYLERTHHIIENLNFKDISFGSLNKYLP